MSIIVGIFLVYLWKKKNQKKYGAVISEAWGCGNPDINSRMQYTASSFADELNEISKSVLVYHKNIKVPKGIFPVRGNFESHSDDFVDNKLLLPGIKKFSLFISKIRFLSITDIRYYIASILIIITIYSLIAFLWN